MWKEIQVLAWDMYKIAIYKLTVFIYVFVFRSNCKFFIIY
jgi:hypothetical protein